MACFSKGAGTTRTKKKSHVTDVDQLRGSVDRVPTNGPPCNHSDRAVTRRIDAGWTLGGGVEYALSRDWRLKAEYLYMDFGSERSIDPDGDVYEHENALHVIKVGLNYDLDPQDPPLK